MISVNDSKVCKCHVHVIGWRGGKERGRVRERVRWVEVTRERVWGEGREGEREKEREKRERGLIKEGIELGGG